MIIRIFIALLVLNLVAFVVRAEASGRLSEDVATASTSAQIVEVQERVSGYFGDDSFEALTDIGARFPSDYAG